MHLHRSDLRYYQQQSRPNIVGTFVVTASALITLCAFASRGYYTPPKK